MSKFSSSNAFADPEDSQLVADAKKAPVDPVEYSYTEVRLVDFDRCAPLTMRSVT